jgi:hypothetical protein
LRTRFFVFAAAALFIEYQPLLVPQSEAQQESIFVASSIFALGTTTDQRPQLSPSIAYDGAGIYLVVWQQGRRYHEQQEGDILAVRVDRHGRVLDLKPIVICAEKGSQEAPQVEYSNGVFLVVWQDYRTDSQWDVYGARVTAEGKVLDSGGFKIAATPASEALPQVAPAPTGFLLAWQVLGERYYELQASSVSSRGAVTALGLRDGTAPLYGGTPALARLSSGWLLSWKDERAWTRDNANGTITRRFARLAEPSDRRVLVEVRTSPASALGGSGGRWISAGNHALFAGWGVVGRGQRVATASLFAAGSAIALPNPNTEEKAGISDWNTQRMIPIFALSIAVEGPVAADFGCGVYLLIARKPPTRAPSTNYQLVAARLAPDGRRLDHGAVSVHESSTPVAGPVLKFGGDAFLLVWEQQDAVGRKTLYARPLKPSSPGVCRRSRRSKGHVKRPWQQHHPLDVSTRRAMSRDNARRAARRQGEDPDGTEWRGRFRWAG